MYGHCGHLGHVTWIIYIHIDNPFLLMLHINLALIGQPVSEEMMFEYYGYIHVYCPGVGADEPLGSNFFRIINIQSYCPFSARLSL